MGSRITIGINDLQKTMGRIVGEITEKTELAEIEARHAVAEEACEKLKAASPVGTGKRAGSYAKGWQVKENKKGESIVWNATDYRLTHLLEWGHQIVIHGTATDEYTSPQSHIKKVEQWVKEEYPARFEEELIKQYMDI